MTQHDDPPPVDPIESLSAADQRAKTALELIHRTDHDVALLAFVVSDLWHAFRPLASRMVLHENLDSLRFQRDRLVSLVQTVEKYGQRDESQSKTD